MAVDWAAWRARGVYDWNKVVLDKSERALQADVNQPLGKVLSADDVFELAAAKVSLGDAWEGLQPELLIQEVVRAAARAISGQSIAVVGRALIEASLDASLAELVRQHDGKERQSHDPADVEALVQRNLRVLDDYDVKMGKTGSA